MTIPLTLCCGAYDITAPLINGEVVPDGIDLTVLTDSSPRRHWRMSRYGEFDVCEFSFARTVMMCSGDNPEVVAIPAFPHRRFRHGSIYVRSDSPITEPSQLNGTRIGLRAWQNTAGLWLRGMLGDYYDVDLSSITWVCQDEEDLALARPDALAQERVAPGQTVFDMLAAGELDAVIYPERPDLDDGSIRRLFADPKAAEIEFYRRSLFFPIMHAVVVKKEVVDRNPWVADSLLDAFREAKSVATRRMGDPRSVSLAWLESVQSEQLDVLGDDPWSYDFERNRVQLEALTRWAYEQGLVAKPVEPEQLFFPSTLTEAPRYVS
jgi:4,5-dihydroxyphthalate decarboxylase